MQLDLCGLGSKNQNYIFRKKLCFKDLTSYSDVILSHSEYCSARLQKIEIF
jgi:hypothetical protein